MNGIFIIGIGMTPFGRHLDRSIKDLTREAVEAALSDAGCERTQLGLAVFSNVAQGHMEGQHSIRGQIALRAMGIDGIPVVNVENACASGSSALALATSALGSGMAEIALAVGVEKLYSEDRERMFAAFDAGWDVSIAEENRQRLLALGAAVEVPEGSQSDAPYSVFMDVYAALARQHMRLYGSTQTHFAAVAAKNHRHSVHNPLAQYRRPYTTEEVLAGRPIVYPLTVPMCSPVSDGAAAVALCTERALARLGRRRAVAVRAVALRSGSERDPDDLERHISRRAAAAAWEQAGLGPEDVSLAEVHDATAVGEVIELEAIGLFKGGEAGPAAVRGETELGGRLPVNPSGGLECRGHPIGATGLAQTFELVTQLRGEAGPRQVEGARVAVAENGGGLIGVEEAAVCVTVLSR
ncbi:MAG TPA: thiolase family protein [Myxococcota bacterium]|nr:thiolase family protein [Myxococcota bacterium]